MESYQRSEPAGTHTFCMQGGHGEDSYANSSAPQNFLFRMYAMPHLSEALHLLCSSQRLLEGRHLAIADLGCAYGPNTLDFATIILQGLQKNLCINGSSPIEMQYLFCDLPANNFNALFQSLQGFLQGIGDNPSGKIFTGAVAGSFYGPLFPTCSLHFAISATSLHWMSQVPPAVLDKKSPAWNGGSIWLHGQRPKVLEAYATQHQKDLRVFFQNRARELVRGGILFLLLLCRTELHPLGPLCCDDPRIDIWTDFFDSTWTEMISEGLISENERDMFNIPFYFCHKMELQMLLEEFVGVLEIVKIEKMSNCLYMPKEDEKKILEDPQAFGKFWATFISSLTRPMVDAHLGEARGEELFRRLRMNITKKSSKSTYMLSNQLVAIIRRI